LIEVDAALEIANDLEYLKDQHLQRIEEAMIRCFKVLCGMIQAKL